VLTGESKEMAVGLDCAFRRVSLNDNFAMIPSRILLGRNFSRSTWKSTLPLPLLCYTSSVAVG
jgi:hypothetical protein